MPEIKLSKTGYRPGEEIAGVVEGSAGPVEARLVWTTRGKGTVDTAVAGAVTCSGEFRIKLPDGPYSFSGRLISLIWAVEAGCARKEFVLSETGEEVLLYR